jgi:hypothetical protein
MYRPLPGSATIGTEGVRDCGIGGLKGLLDLQLQIFIVSPVREAEDPVLPLRNRPWNHDFVAVVLAHQGSPKIPYPAGKGPVPGLVDRRGHPHRIDTERMGRAALNVEHQGVPRAHRKVVRGHLMTGIRPTGQDDAMGPDHRKRTRQQADQNSSGNSERLHEDTPRVCRRLKSRIDSNREAATTL